MFVMMDGSWEQGKKGSGRLNLHTNFFTYAEVKTLQNILAANYNITTYLRYEKTSQPDRGYIIRIPGRYVITLREKLDHFILSGLKYKLGYKA